MRTREYTCVVIYIFSPFVSHHRHTMSAIRREETISVSLSNQIMIIFFFPHLLIFSRKSGRLHLHRYKYIHPYIHTHTHPPSIMLSHPDCVFVPQLPPAPRSSARASLSLSLRVPHPFLSHHHRRRHRRRHDDKYKYINDDVDDDGDGCHGRSSREYHHRHE